jgi:hypothetical protein
MNATGSALFAVTAALLFGPPLRAEELEPVTYEPSVRVIAPLAGEGLLWAPVLSPTPGSQIAFQFAYGYHGFDWILEEVDASVYLLVLRGEYTFWDKLTLGAGVPFLVGYDVSTESDAAEESDVDFGNIRLHARYPLVEVPERGFILTAAFRVWLPTNTFLSVAGRRVRIDVIDNFAVFEPMLLIGLDVAPLSVLFETGPKLYAVNDQEDFSFWSFNFIFGAAPFSALPELEFLIELNMFVELSEDDAPRTDSGDHIVPLALSFGPRYRFGDFYAELALRLGLNDAEFYYGDFSMGIQLGYLFGY